MKTMVIVHCSATPPDMDIGTKEIRAWHVRGNGWRDIGYNYVLRRSGALEGGRDLDNDGDFDEEIGAHAKGFNTQSIGICLVGGIDSDGNPECNYTIGQMIGLSNLVDRIRRDNPSILIVGHHDVNPGKACPCFNVKELLGEL